MKFKNEMKRLSERYSLSVQELSQFGYSLKDYSTFNRNDIMKIICEIASSIEGVNYRIVKEARIQDSHQEFVYCALVQHDVYGKYGFGADIESLEAIKKALFFDITESVFSENISFYNLNHQSMRFTSPVRFNNFPYLEEFIDGVIAYKIEHNLNRISREELDRLKSRFLIRKTKVGNIFICKTKNSNGITGRKLKLRKLGE